MSDLNKIINSDTYTDFINQIKNQIQASQTKAAISVNKEMLKLYWFIGSEIVEKQKNSNWGDGFIKQVSEDLKNEFLNIKGFSVTNLKYMKKWYLFFSKSPQLVDDLQSMPFLQIPWGHNREIITKLKSQNEALFYVAKTIENNWSRNVLTHQIEAELFQREGKAITNFETNLPAYQSDLAKQILKDPYNFDFLTINEKYNERELEKAITSDITNFLLELGTGFSYIGKQYKLTVDNNDFYIDLLFYHVKLHSYVVVELKTGNFKPEFAGKLNFYVSAVDDMLKTELDKPTIGILICKEKSKTIVEYALKDISKPIGVSQYVLSKYLPKEYKQALPSIEQIEKEIDLKL